MESPENKFVYHGSPREFDSDHAIPKRNIRKRWNKEAEIYDVIFDDEVLDGSLPKYDWLHLHHEDFTGQYGKFFGVYQNMPWYLEQQKEAEDMARKHSFPKVSQLKLAVAKRIKEFVASGGFLFAMCGATESLDLAVAAFSVDIAGPFADGNPPQPDSRGARHEPVRRDP